MLTKLLFNTLVLIVFCQTLCNCQSIRSDDKSNQLNGRQWNHWVNGVPSVVNHWPSSKWNASQWPAASWPPAYPWSTIFPPIPGVTWPGIGGRPTHQPPHQPPQEPPTPEEPSPSEPETESESPAPVSISTHPPTHRPTTPKRPPVTKPSQPSEPATHKPATHKPNPPAVENPGEDASKITVKSCGLSHIPHEFNLNKIVSGKIAKSGEFPWQVILKINTAKGNMQCGGAILNSRWILTAAHCVSNERDGQPTANRIDITAGVHNRLQMAAGAQQKTADCVIQHESWKGQGGNFKHDIALLRLPTNQPFELTYEKGGHVNGICLPTAHMSEYSGKARIAGWGLTKDRGTPSDVLLYTDVSIIPNDKCRQYQYPVPIADSMICQGVDRTAPCQGDSGGALIIPISDQRGVQRFTEVGIVSFGPGKCANTQTPNAIYTKVSHFLKWIEKTIQTNTQKCARPLRTGAVDKLGEILDNEIEANSTVTEENLFF